MHISIPIGYTALCVEHGKRKPQTQHFFEWIKIAIETPSVEEAPIAVAWREEFPTGSDRFNASFASQREYADWGSTSADGTMHTRWFNGRHFWPLKSEYENQDRFALFDKMSSEMYQRQWIEDKRGYPIAFTGLHHETVDKNPSGRPLDYSQFRSVENSTRDTAIDAVIASARQLIIVDDIVYREVAEPVYVVGCYVDTPEGEQGLLRIVPMNHKNLTKSTNFWSLQQFDDALAHIESIGSFRRGDKATPKDNISLEREAIIKLPESLKSDVDLDAIEKIGKRVIASYDDCKLGALTDQLVLSYIAFRRGYRHFSETRETDDVYNAAVDLRNCLSRDDYRHNWLSELIERHEMRPVKRNFR